MADQDMSNGVYGDDISDEYQWPQIYIFPFVLTIFFFFPSFWTTYSQYLFLKYL